MGLDRTSKEGALRDEESTPGLFGESAVAERLRAIVEKAARVDSTVLLRGESGAGKETVARAIHGLSRRADKPWVAVNCGAIPPELLASELFGHERGAFTGAVSRRKGCFERASSGTLMLDEIGEMSPEMQVKLLRVLEERQFERLGSQAGPIPVDARIIAATNQDLDSAIAEGRFRADLFYRLNVVTITVPPLRERPEDLNVLIDSISSALAARGLVPPHLPAATRTLMRRYQWPGNVRQLFNVVERLSVLHPGESVGPDDLPPDMRGPLAGEGDAEPGRPEFAPLPCDLGEGFSLKEYLNGVEAELIDVAMDEADGVVAEAARLLGVRRTTLVEKLRRSRQDEAAARRRSEVSGRSDR